MVKRVKRQVFKVLQNTTHRNTANTQIVGHGDEAEASDVGVVSSFVELLAGCVVAREALGALCNSHGDR